MDWFAIKRARALILLDFDFNISFRAGKVVWTFEKRVPGLKTGVENDILWSEIGSGFGEPGGTWAAHHHQEYPGVLPPGYVFGKWIGLSSGKRFFRRIAPMCVILWVVIYPVGTVMHLFNN